MIKRAWGKCANHHNKIRKLKLPTFEQGNTDMIRKLTKCRRNGKPYVRPGKVEAEIGAVYELSAEILQERLNIMEPEKSGYISSECLMYLTREVLRSKVNNRYNVVLPVLFARCKTTLAISVSDKMLPDAEGVREEIFGRFEEMVVEDGSGENPDRLDFYEIRFNLAFRYFYLDAIRKERKHSQNTVPLPDVVSETASGRREDGLHRVPEALQATETPEDIACRDELVQAINNLPPDEQKAVMLRCMEYKVESEDSAEITMATLCKCSGRTVRNRLARAAAKLQKFKESIS